MQVNHDENIQSIKQPNEDPLGHQARILISYKINLTSAKGSKLNLIPRNLSRKDSRDHLAVRIAGDQSEQDDQADLIKDIAFTHFDYSLHLVYLSMEAKYIATGNEELQGSFHY